MAVILVLVGLLGSAWLSAGQAPGGYGAAAAGAPPPWPEEQRLFASDQVFTHSFATDVALDGETAIVGAGGAKIGDNLRQGAAYIFVLDEGEWVEQAQLLAHDGAAEDWFGGSVAIDGDTAVVGAYLANIEGEINQGAVYVFFRIGEEWFEGTKLVAADGDELAEFGYSVALEGDTLVVGAPSAQGAVEGCQGPGAAYVFTKEGVPWIEQAKLSGPGLNCSALFGSDVALQEGTALMGAPNALIEGEPGRGAAYAFSGAANNWSLEQELLASDGEGADGFGNAVALDRDTAVVGAWQDDVGGQTNQGAAYVFRRSGTTWTEEQHLVASDGQVDGFFGIGAALLDNVALVGAQFDFPGDPQRGVVYEYRHQGGAWVEIQRFAAPEGNGLDSFGQSIALNRDRVLIAHPGEAVLPPVGGSAWTFGRPVLFEDGFETGDTSAWSQTVP